MIEPVLAKCVEDAPEKGDLLRLRGRPRNPKTDEMILDAARTLLATKGFEALSFEAIAQMTGITRATIYRRWPTKAHLANEVGNRGEEGLADVLDVEGLDGQIEAWVRQVLAQYRRPEKAAAAVGLITAYQREPLLRDELHTPAEMEARTQLRDILARARKAGLIRTSIDADALFDLIIGAILFRTMFSSVDAPADYADEISMILLQGLRPGSGTSE